MMSTSITLVTVLLIGALVIIFSKKAVKSSVESYGKQKQFITNASHEIKTPLAIIQANTELLEVIYGENEWSKSIQKQVARLKGLTENLTMLARMDEGEKPIHKEAFSLTSLVEEAYNSFLPLAACQNKKLTATIEKDVIYVGALEMLGEVVNIMLDNALKYAVSYIEIKLFKGSMHILVVIYSFESSVMK